MAIAGLHNVSVLDSSFLRESQPETARQRDDDGRMRSTRASSLLQMWRELEDEHAVSHHAHGRNSERSFQQRSDGVNSEISVLDASDSRGSEHSGLSDTVSIGESDYGQWSPGPIGSENGQEDSSDLGENERERVRQIFREWMNAGARERTSNVSRRNNGSRAEWLGETEQERVRVIREWVHMNTQHRGPFAERREEQSSEVVGQIEQVLDGSVVNRNEGRPEHSRRGFRRLCGRQALLDMLKKSERELQRELQGLLEHRAVSQFAHRGRIQSLLRGRFLRNDRLIEDERTSVAASELGLLRQRHTVSDLREGFSSRLDHSTCIHGTSNASDTSSNNDVNNSGNENYHESNTNITDALQERIESNVRETTDTQVNTLENTRWTEPPHLTDESRQFANNVASATDHSDAIELVGRQNDLEAEVNRNSLEYPDGEPSEGVVENEAREPIVLPVAGEVFLQRPVPNGEESTRSTGSDHAVDSVDNSVEDVSLHEAAADEEHLNQNLMGVETVSSGVGLRADINEHENETAANELMETEDRVADQVWHEDDGSLQEQAQDWLDEPSDQDVNPMGRMDSFYFPDDDNVYSMELRELVSRRSVSTLLRSGFRESLDQLIRSYVERQSHTSLDWEGQGVSPTPASAEQELEQRGSDQNEGLGDAVQSPPLAPPPPRLPPVQHLWGQDAHHYDWAQHDMHNRFGIDWDVINDLRIDMARLQSRMNNMQRMLEACMDMQLELQRSIRQEVSAALNRSAGLSGSCENGLSEDRSKWDHVRKGMCCICCDSSIDSLLYRCGHMCTCSKCAYKLVQDGEKCPMCRAPVIEVIRAYSIM